MRDHASKILRSALWLGLSLGLGLNGCAGLKPKADEYGLLKDKINQYHDAALAGSKVPYLFGDSSSQPFVEDFIHKSCPGESPARPGGVSAACSEKLQKDVFTLLEQRYFAADEARVEDHCRDEPMTCTDLETLEVLFRKLHNEGIEESRKSKLQDLEDWRAGRISDTELARDLHFEMAREPATLVSSAPR